MAKHVPKLTEKDRQEMAEEKRRNFEERLALIDQRVAWMKRTPNAEWSKQQNALIDGQYQRRRALDRVMEGAAQLGDEELVKLGRELKKGRGKAGKDSQALGRSGR